MRRRKGIVLRETRALITGASSGIGREVALALADKGVILALSARRERALQAVAAEIGRTGAVPPAVLPTDLAVPGNAGALAAQAKGVLGEVDILVCAAGIGLRAPQWVGGDGGPARELFETNYWSPLALIDAEGGQKAVPLKPAGGNGSDATLPDASSHLSAPSQPPCWISFPP